MKRPHIAIVRQRYNPSGGAERFVNRAIAALIHQVDVSLISRRWDGDPGERGITLNPFYIGNVWREWSFRRSVLHCVARQNFDLVQSHERIPGLTIYRAGDGVHREWLAQRERVQSPWVRRLSRLNPFHAYMLRTERKMFEHPDLHAVICISRMVKRDILRHFKISPDKLRVIYNSIDCEQFHPQLRESHRQTLREQLGIPADSTALVFVGAGFERKGLSVALRALAKAATNGHLIVVGRDKRAKRYHALAAQLGIAERVHFVGTQADVRPYYAAADALIFPTLYEPFGNVHLEAMAMALPILTSDHAGAAEWVVPGINGFVHDPLDVAAFARSISLLDKPESCQRLGHAARKTVEPYTPAAMAAQLTDLYQELLANRLAGETK